MGRSAARGHLFFLPPKVFMKRAALPLMAIVMLASAACGSDKAARHEGGPEHAMKRHSSGGIHSVDPSPGMSIDNELGVLDTEDVEATMKQHFDDIRGC